MVYFVPLLLNYCVVSKMLFTKSIVTITGQILVSFFMMQLIVGRFLWSCAFIVTIGLMQINFDPMDVCFFELRISSLWWLET